MTSSHIFFIPGMIIIGMFFGFIIGARAARNQVDMERRREEERDAARAARAARREAAGKTDDRPPVEAERASDDAITSGKSADEPKPKPSDSKPPTKKQKRG